MITTIDTCSGNSRYTEVKMIDTRRAELPAGSAKYPECHELVPHVNAMMSLLDQQPGWTQAAPPTSLKPVDNGQILNDGASRSFLSPTYIHLSQTAYAVSIMFTYLSNKISKNLVPFLRF